jgi:diguanylate cyclase (GGDEF)-like protein
MTVAHPTIQARTEQDVAEGYRRLARVLRSLVGEQSSQAVLTRIAIDLRELVPCDDVVIWGLHADKLSAQLVDGEDENEMRQLQISLGDGITGTAVLHQEMIVSADAHLDPRAGHVPGTERQPEAIICVPLSARGVALGALSLYRRGDDRAFQPSEVELVAHFADVAAVALHNATTLVELQRLAATDDLTGLENRRRFYEELERHAANAARHKTPLSLLLLDLDNFKAVNDRHGHQVGDSALRAVARTIKSRVRAGDLAARLGGDEFAILLQHTTYAEAGALARELTISLEATKTTPVPLRVSIGAACCAASCTAATAEALVTRADRRLYEHKRTRPA